MAIWQFQCNIIPKRNNYDELSRDEIISWRGVQYKAYKIDFLDYKKSWSKNITQYGNIDGTCIELIFFNGKVDEINCRLDLRSLTKHKLTQIVEYVENIQAVFFIENNIYPPDINIIVEVIKKSDANRFCRKPVEYLKNINTKNDSLC